MLIHTLELATFISLLNILHTLAPDDPLLLIFVSRLLPPEPTVFFLVKASVAPFIKSFPPCPIVADCPGADVLPTVVDDPGSLGFFPLNLSQFSFKKVAPSARNALPASAPYARFVFPAEAAACNPALTAEVPVLNHSETPAAAPSRFVWRAPLASLKVVVIPEDASAIPVVIPEPAPLIPSEISVTIPGRSILGGSGNLILGNSIFTFGVCP